LIFDISSVQVILGVGWVSKSDSPDLKKKTEDFFSGSQKDSRPQR
jgi:hypothetical protein